MLRLPRRTSDEFGSSSRPPASEVPPGFRLRRVGPGEWVAEPSRRVWLTIVLVVAGLAIGAIGGALAARRYYHSSATKLLAMVQGLPVRRDEFRAQLETRYGARQMEQIVAQELARGFATSQDCWPTDAQLQARFEKERARPEYLDMLAIEGLTEDEFRMQLRLDMSEANLLTKGITVTPEEVRAFYVRNTDPANPHARFHTPTRVQVAVISTSTLEAARSAVKDLAAGMAWPVAVARYSEDRSRTAGGLWLPFARGESLFAASPQAENSIFTMVPGVRLGPIAAARRWWVLRCIGRWRPETIPWDEAKDEARLGALLEKGIPRNRNAVEKARAEYVQRASVRFFDDAYGEAKDPVLSRPVR